MRKLLLASAIVAALTTGIAIFNFLDTPGHIGAARGEVVGYTYGGGKTSSTLTVVIVRLESGVITDFSSAIALPPSNGRCVEFSRFKRKYSQRNEYRFLRFC